MTSATLEAGVPLDNSMGAMFIGVVVSGVLHGICLVQAFYYFTHYQNDPMLIKAMVATAVSFDAIHLSFVSHAMYHYLVTNFRREEMLQRIIWSVIIEAVLTGVNAGIVQTFYTYRIWKLSKRNWYLSSFIVVLILATTACGIAWVILGMGFETYFELLTINPLTITINALSTTVDVIIAATLCWLLNKSRTGFKRSDNIINKLMLFVVNTGVLTTACAISSLICLVASPKTLIYAAFYFCIGRFYTNSFLATLNARKSISGKSQNSESTSHMVMSVPTSALNSASATHHLSRSGKQDIAIRIETTREAVLDVPRGAGETLRMSSRTPNRDRKVDLDAESTTDDENAPGHKKRGPL